MKVLAAIENELDAKALVECIRNRDWPPTTEFVLVHVIDVGNRFAEGDTLSYRQEEMDSAASEAYHVLLQASHELERDFPRKQLELAVCVGEPTGEILDAIYRAHPDVVVIGKHPRNRLMRLFHQDVGEHLMSLIPTDVNAVHVVDVPPLKKPVRAKTQSRGK